MAEPKPVTDDSAAESVTTPAFTMEFQPQTIEHLGLRLYSSLPPVIGELVSNAWDADSPDVDIQIPTGSIAPTSEVVITDHGRGMNANDLQQHYLQIGRDRREEEKTDKSPGGRNLTGRKGLGKLSAFGVANEIELRTVRNGNAICLRFRYSEMKTWPRGKPYEPTVIKERSGPTTDGNGTEIRIRGMHRTAAIQGAWIRRELARRFRFIGAAFVVRVNGQAMTEQQGRRREDCKISWPVEDLPAAGVVDADRDWRVTGWIGLLDRSSQIERGVDIYARDKAVELDTMFGLKTTHAQFARAYVIGEVHAEFLDAEEDNIATARNTANWESEAGQALAKWGETALVEVLRRWVQQRQEEKREKVIKTAGFDDWLKTRSVREQKVAQRLVNVIVSDDTIDPESAAPLLEIIKTNVEFAAFQELVDEIEESGASVETLLRLFEEWRIVEARERLRMADGHLETMEKLAKFIKEGALEVQQMQPLFEQNTWLIDPAWSEAEGQTTYTDLLRRQFPDKGKPAEERRLDILGVKVGGELIIVELKRPEKTLSRDDLDQIENYVDWARTEWQAAGGTEGPRLVTGRLIVGKRNRDAALHQKEVRLAGSSITVLTYPDLLQQARTVYGATERKLHKVAPEYSASARKKRNKKALPAVKKAAALLPDRASGSHSMVKKKKKKARKSSKHR